MKSQALMEQVASLGEAVQVALVVFLFGLLQQRRNLRQVHTCVPGASERVVSLFVFLWGDRSVPQRAGSDLIFSDAGPAPKPRARAPGAKGGRGGPRGR